MEPLKSALFDRLPWLDHGFATRLTQDWPEQYTSLKQIHSDVVAVADGVSGCIGRGDALVTTEPGKWIGVRTADCVPILIADERRRVVAAVHAGWRGTVAEIAPKTVALMQERFNSNPADLLIAVGPGIGPCCFEVGPEVAARFPEEFHSGLRNIDLAGANCRQLLDARVQPERIEMLGYCTMCNADRFHSFRRDREASGRMVTAIQLRKEA